MEWGAIMEATRRIVSIALGRALNSYLLSFPPLLSFLLLAFFRTLPSSILATPLTLFGDARELLMKCYCSSGALTGRDGYSEPELRVEATLGWNERHHSQAPP